MAGDPGAGRAPQKRQEVPRAGRGPWSRQGSLKRAGVPKPGRQGSPKWTGLPGMGKQDSPEQAGLPGMGRGPQIRPGSLERADRAPQNRQSSQNGQVSPNRQESLKWTGRAPQNGQGSPKQAGLPGPPLQSAGADTAGGPERGCHPPSHVPTGSQQPLTHGWGGLEKYLKKQNGVGKAGFLPPNAGHARQRRARASRPAPRCRFASGRAAGNCFDHKWERVLYFSSLILHQINLK